MERIMDITDKQLNKIRELRGKLWNFKRITTPITLESMLGIIPEEDFSWDDDISGDWHVYNCGEKDCPIGWHKVSYATNVSRKNGKLLIERIYCDEDGNWDYDYAWEEGEDWEEMGLLLANESYEYFRGWAQYYLDCAITGEDPLDEIIGGINNLENPIDFLIDSAKDNILYLTELTTK